MGGKYFEKDLEKDCSAGYHGSIRAALLPVAAFGAAGDFQTTNFSVVKDGKAQSTATVEAGDTLTAQFFVYDNEGYGATEALDTTDKTVKIWAEDVTNANSAVEPSSALTVDNPSGISGTGSAADYTWTLTENEEITNGDSVSVKFSRPGIYVLHAGYVTDASNVTDVKDFNTFPGATTVTVTAKGVDTASVGLKVTPADLAFDATADVGSDGTLDTDLTNNGKATVTTQAAFLLNGLQDTTITATAKQQDGKAAMNEKFTFRSSGSGLVLDKTEDTTDAYGNFDITFSINKADTYRIYVTGDDISFTIEINAENTAVDTIETTADNAQPMLAGNDKYFSTTYGTNYDEDAYFLEDAVQFEIKDKSGNVMKDTAVTGQPAQTAGGQHNNYVKVTEAEGSTLTADDIVLAWSAAKEAFTLKYVGGDAEHDLVPGEYTVSVGLTSGEVATATFTLANYGTTQDVVVDLKYGPAATAKEVTDEVVLPTTVSGNNSDLVATAKYVDENGIKIDVQGDNVQYGFNGQAVDADATKSQPNNTAVLKAASENLLGSTITVTVIDDSIPVMKVVPLTVVDGYGAYSLAFDGENGLVNENNEVVVSVVDENGNVVKDVKSGTMIAYVDSQSNADAVVELEPGNVSNGKATLVINSDKETTVDVAVAIKDNSAANAGAMYVGNLSYTIGGEDVNADTIVGMTIGSTDYIVNNDVISGDAAPYIDENWRTMAPVRVINETFGATVDYKDNVITIVKGDTTVVMTVGETTYTVNDTEYAMDTAPVIRDNDRAYVPARFMAEALGYTVTTLKDANGLTAGVIFQK